MQVRYIRLLNQIAYLGLVVVTGAVIWQNLALRRDRQLLLRLRQPAAAARVRPGLQVLPGDQISIMVEGPTGEIEPFQHVAGRTGSYWWFFDPECSACAESARLLDAASQERATPISALTRTDRSGAAAFLKRYNLKANLFVVAEKAPDFLSVVPQFLRVDDCGTVMRTFSSQEEFIAEGNGTKGVTSQAKAVASP